MNFADQLKMDGAIRNLAFHFLRNPELYDPDAFEKMAAPFITPRGCLYVWNEVEHGRNRSRGEKTHCLHSTAV